MSPTATSVLSAQLRRRSIIAGAVVALALSACGSDPAAGDVEPLPAPADVGDPSTTEAEPSVTAPVETEPTTTDPVSIDPDRDPDLDPDRDPGQPDADDDPSAITAGFGSNDNRSACYSTVLTNGPDDAALVQSGVGCLRGTALPRLVVWDVATPTVEGDPIFHRYLHDAEGFLIVHDDRADRYGSREVIAERCDDLVATDFLPTGVDCEPRDHPGFPEADSTDPVPVADVFDDVRYYGACGNETVEVGGVRYYPVPHAQGAALAYTHPVSETPGEPAGLLRVPSPEPGDDIGTFVVFDDGVARFESESGRVLWLTDDEIVYWFVC